MGACFIYISFFCESTSQTFEMKEIRDNVPPWIDPSFAWTSPCRTRRERASGRFPSGERAAALHIRLYSSRIIQRRKKEEKVPGKEWREE